MQPYAVFDIDGTIYRYALFQQLLERLVDQNVIPRTTFTDFENEMAAWKNRTHSESFHDFAMAEVRVFDDHIAKIPVDRLEAIAREVIEESAGHVYVYTRDLIAELKGKGYFMIAISGSISEVAHPFAEHYGFDVIESSVYERQGNRYTGAYTLKHNEKHTHLKKLIQAHNLTQKGSIAVGDSLGDKSMLAMVEHPIAFNPEQTLFEEANKHGWKIVIERKNMMYELEQVNGRYTLA